MRESLKNWLWLLRCLSWPFLVVAILLAVGSIGGEMREYAFENSCPDGMRHLLHETDDTHASWCDSWWWHPLRALSRLIPGAIGLLTIWLLCRFYLRNTLSGYLFTAIFVTLGSLLRIALYLAEPFKNWFPQNCLFGTDPSLRDLCVQQLGTYGDQYFYLPALFPFALWAIFFLEKARQLKDS